LVFQKSQNRINSLKPTTPADLSSLWELRFSKALIKKMIKLADLISLTGLDFEDFKIHCATGKPNPPLEAFFDGRFKEWQEYQNQQNFQCGQILSIIHLRNDLWLFSGVFRVLGFEKKEDKNRIWYNYKTEEIQGLEHLVGRVVIQFKKNFRASYLIGSKYIEKLLVSEIRSQKMSVGDFPGYNSVLISHRLLCTIIREELPSWKSALCNVSGVYIITDTTVHSSEGPLAEIAYYC